jgi:MerR family redox-sensitive transcriptional activator SoxR
MSEQTERMTIGEAARRAGVKAATLRYYELVGVLPEPERVSGQRRYGAEVLRRLEIIDVAQRAGCSLEEIRDLLSAADENATARLRALAERKLPEMEALIARARAAHRWFAEASACDCETLDVCGLFEGRALGVRGLEPGRAGPAQDGVLGAGSTWAAAAPTSSIGTP